MSSKKPVNDRVRVGVYYDFASSLCYVAHRVLDRILPRLQEIEVELLWKPIDLTQIVPWDRGDRFADAIRESVEATAQSLHVQLRMPRAWLDSRPSSAVALALESGPAEVAWRHAVFDSIFGQLSPARAPDVAELLRRLDLDTSLDPGLGSGLDDDPARGLESQLARVEKATEEAIALGIEGVPTFLLDHWPVGGIHDDDAMFHMLSSYAEKVREAGARELVN